MVCLALCEVSLPVLRVLPTIPCTHCLSSGQCGQIQIGQQLCELSYTRQLSQDCMCSPSSLLSLRKVLLEIQTDVFCSDLRQMSLASGWGSLTLVRNFEVTETYFGSSVASNTPA